MAAGTIYIGRINTGYTHTENEWANPAMINLNGGTAQVYQIVRDYRRSKSASSRAFVNFNGGTLRTTHPKGAFGAPEAVCDAAGESCGVDRVTVFAGGGTFDTNGRDVSSRMPISAPVGQGVVAVSVPEAVLSKTFAAPPTVTIIGDGEGASARVLFNPQSGKVTGVSVLSPGWGYTKARARFNHGGYESLGEKVAELDDVVCGQFVKTGAGTYTFLCVNTVTDVKVAGGRIRNGVDNVFTSDAALTLDGGDYDVNGFSQTFKSIAFGTVGGKILNGTVTAGGLSCDFAAAAANHPGTADLSNVTFAPGAKTIVTGYDPAVCASADKVVLLNFPSGGAPSSVPPLDDAVVLPKGWTLRLTPTCLKLAKDGGMVLIFR